MNPLARGDFLLSRFEDGGGSPLPRGGRAVLADACLGVPGRPQSATGQSAILSGENAPGGASGSTCSASRTRGCGPGSSRGRSSGRWPGRGGAPPSRTPTRWPTCTRWGSRPTGSRSFPWRSSGAGPAPRRPRWPSRRAAGASGPGRRRAAGQGAHPRHHRGAGQRLRRGDPAAGARGGGRGAARHRAGARPDPLRALRDRRGRARALDGAGARRARAGRPLRRGRWSRGWATGIHSWSRATTGTSRTSGTRNHTLNPVPVIGFGPAAGMVDGVTDLTGHRAVAAGAGVVSPGIGSPLRLGSGLELPNRLAKAAMTEGLADRRGWPGSRLRTALRAVGGGGCGPGRHRQRHGGWALPGAGWKRHPRGSRRADEALSSWGAAARKGCSGHRPVEPPRAADQPLRVRHAARALRGTVR